VSLLDLIISEMWNEGRTLLLVTGASRGLGRAWAKALSARLSEGSLVALSARTVKDLEETAAFVQREGIEVRVFEIDHGKVDAEGYRRLVSGLGTEFDSIVVVHNAGSTGKMMPVSRYDQPEEVAAYLALNYTSPAVLNSVLLQRFEPLNVKNITIINISSLCGIQPFPTLGHYCSVKAARDMLFKVLAAEEGAKTPTDGRNFKVLNYAPGPIDTEMVKGMIADPGADPSVKGGFEKLYSDRAILQPEQTAEKLIKILDLDSFESGQHVDYYDVD